MTTSAPLAHVLKSTRKAKRKDSVPVCDAATLWQTDVTCNCRIPAAEPPPVWPMCGFAVHLPTREPLLFEVQMLRVGGRK